jgi:hypothetical protein
MKRGTGILFLFYILVGAVLGEGEGESVYRQRLREVLEQRANAVDVQDYRTGGLAAIEAKLALRQDAEWCSRRLIEIMREPTGDMFWMFPCVAIANLGEEQLSTEAKQALRAAWKNYMPMRGDTENHWLMYYASLFLMAERWPGEPGDRWFNGKSSDENRDEAESYLRHWIKITTERGQGEYDCTHYIAEYCIPLIELATWSRDPEMKKLGAMMLDYILADFAVDTLDGIYAGAHARTDDTQVLEKWNGMSSYFAWVFFGNCPRPRRNEDFQTHFSAVAYASSYLVPEMIRRIALDRDEPYTQKEVKRFPAPKRGPRQQELPVYKQTYMTRDYAVGSDQGGGLGPIQHHSWDVTWAVKDPRGVHSTIFSTHPHVSIDELQMYFAEYPDALGVTITQQNKPTYLSPDKLIGSSVYEQVFQDKDCVIALYDIPAGTQFGHVSGFFSKDLTRVEEDSSGWIFVQGGNTYIAYRPLAPYVWSPLSVGGRRLHSPHLKNGTVIQAASVTEFSSWEKFKEAIRALEFSQALEPVPSVKFRTLRGRLIEAAYGQGLRLDGEAVDFSRWKLFEGPYLNAELGSRRLEIRHGEKVRMLDFDKVSIEQK